MIRISLTCCLKAETTAVRRSCCNRLFQVAGSVTANEGVMIMTMHLLSTAE